jgi:PfaB family protein
VHEPIAIVSFGGLFPGGPDVLSFWRNVARAVDAGRPVPPHRWISPPETSFRSGEVVPDKTYSTWSCSLDDIPPAPELSSEDSGALDPVCHLALSAARDAVRSARWERVDPRRVGVILGHIVLPTESTSAMARDVVLRTFEEFVFESQDTTLLQSVAKTSGANRGGERWDRRNRRVAALPARVISDVFGFGGATFTLDAACASSLYALKLAVDELQAGRADAMLAGGLSRPDCQYTQIGFAQLQALSKRGRCAPLSAAADGLVVGEGAALFVLKRLSDALAHGDRIEAVIAGIGLSNDRGANLLAPHSEGQVRAMRAAYEQAGWAPEDVDYIECHATGTPTGDAVELDSLHQLWRDRPYRPGQCVLGAVKSNVGHLLTGAGGAGLMKLLGMLRARELWPIANWNEPAAALRSVDSPFRVITQAEPWPQPAAGRPRRAAINAFGFGGINAHVLIEEWTANKPLPAYDFAATNHPHDDIVVIALDAAVGPWPDLDAVGERLFGNDDSRPVAPLCWGVEQSRWFAEESPRRDLAAYALERIEIPVGEFRIPPTELPDLLPQQQLMLQVTARALAQAGVGRSLGNRAGVFLGVSLDPNTTNFHCRWAIASCAKEWACRLRLPLSRPQLDRWIEDLQSAFGPPLTPNRVMGNLAAITASRIAREFDVGGPSFTISADEDSGLRAVEAAVKALQRRELDLAVVGAVDFGSDVRAQLADLADNEQVKANDAAAVFLLKRRSDAARDGNRILVKIDIPHGSSFRSQASSSTNLERRLGFSLATAGLLRLLRAALCLAEGRDENGAICLRDRQEGPRRIVMEDSRSAATVMLEEVPSANASVTAPGLARRLFVMEGNDAGELGAKLDQLESLANGTESIAIFAHRWFAEHPVSTAKSQAVVVLAEKRDELLRAIGEARRALAAQQPWMSSCGAYHPAPLARDGRLAFVFPGSGNAFLGMGRELLAAFPGILQRQHAENERLRSQFRPDLIWDAASAEPLARDHKAMIFGQVSLGAAMCDLFAAFGVKPAASIGYSLGESAALFGLRAWRDRDAMLARMERSSLFGSDLVFPFDAARKAWSVPADQPVPWLSGVVAAPVAAVREELSRTQNVYLLIINTPTQCVIGGAEANVNDVVRRLRASFVPLSSPSTVHCPILNEVRDDYFALHQMVTTPPEGIDVYSSATGERYALSRDSAAHAILAQAVDTVDFPRVIGNAYRDGVRMFLEIGPGNSCTRMIDDILADKPHWAGTACPATSDPLRQFLGILAQLIVHRVPVDLSPLFSTVLLQRVADRRPRIVTRVGGDFQNLSPVSGAGEKVAEGWAKGASDERQRTTLAPLTPPLSPTGERGPEQEFCAQGFEMAAHQSQLARSAAPSPPHAEPSTQDMVVALGSMIAERTEAHAAFLRFAQRSQELAAQWIATGDADSPSSGAREKGPAFARHSTGVQANARQGAGEFPLHPAPSDLTEPPRALNYAQCLAFAVGKIGDVLGPKFAPIDQFPTRVRLPDEPLMLCHRILDIEGEPLSMTHGRVVTEHDIVENAWYLDCGRIPTCIAVEAGQADLFLSGWLGIDFETRGLAVYRLLDAVVTFHDALPGPGATIRYDIRINRFLRQGETWLFRFEFDATVDGRPLLTMREGCAGFFTEDELAGGKGIVHTTLDRQSRRGKRPDDWTDLVPMAVERYSDDQLAALRAGDLAACFGPAFRSLPLRDPVTLPGGRMRLVDRVLHVNPNGGKYGLGVIRAEADIHPDDWFLTCHFCDDQVMPGTLMYECCLHTLRIYLLRMGWIGENGEIAYEPVPEVRSRLKCRGQVLPTTKYVWYEVTIKELGYAGRGPAADAYCLADALMYADGKPIVEMTDMSLRLSWLTREKVERLWSSSPSGGRKAPQNGIDVPSPVRGADAPRSVSLYDTARITEFAIGKPSKAFGEKYRVFDEERVIARLPGPPFQFLDRIVSIEQCEQWKLAAGGVIVAEYDVPPDAWYFLANRQAAMPFAVLLETALQPCGWLAAYLGSALTSDVDLSFRNLGGKATQFSDVTPDAGTLTTTVKITSVSQSAGMIIQHYEFDLRCRGAPVYQGTTYFGFFSKQALANQVGLRDAALYQPTDGELASATSFPMPRAAPFPDDQLRMVDRITHFVPNGGPHGLGFVRGTIDVDPAAWFFKAHFFQDPVWPGSLGLESFLQLLKVYVARRWGGGMKRTLLSGLGGGERTGKFHHREMVHGPGTPLNPRVSFATAAPQLPHAWLYRGQVIPRDKTVTVDVLITAVDDPARRATASGFLSVDGRVIYQMTDFSLQMTSVLAPGESPGAVDE